MKIRRVVVGNDDQGRSVFLSDDSAPSTHEFAFMPGQAQARIWYVPSTPTTLAPGIEPTSSTGPVIPAPGGSTFMITRFAPDSAVTDPRFDGAKAFEEMTTYAPDLVALMEPDSPGMHRTPTVDYAIVLDGEIWLEVDGGQEVHLTAGDTVVQLGGRHAWHNKSDRTVTMAFILTGAEEAKG